MSTEDALYRICDRPILPGEHLVKVAHDLMHAACLPSRKRQDEEHSKASVLTRGTAAAPRRRL